MAHQNQVELLASLNEYRRSMAMSNRAYMTAKIMEIEDAPGSDLEHLNILAKCWGYKRWPPRNNVESVRKPMDIFDEAKNLDLDNTGTFPPASAEQRQEFAYRLLQEVRASALVPDIALPDDYLFLLQHTNCIYDVDFRRRGPAEIRGTNLDFIRTFEASSSQIKWHNLGWDVAAGWCVGLRRKSMAEFIYCKKRSSSPTHDGQQDWRWRISYFDKDTPLRIFESLSDFLDYQGQWYQRLQVSERSSGLERLSLTSCQ